VELPGRNSLDVFGVRNAVKAPASADSDEQKAGDVRQGSSKEVGVEKKSYYLHGGEELCCPTP
jgi:hypothetical protein